MVKAHKIIGRKAQTLGAILSIGLLSTMAEAGKNPPPVTTPAPVYHGSSTEEVDSTWVEIVRTDTAKTETDNKILPTLRPGSPEAQQIQRNIQARGDKTESFIQRAPTNVPLLTAAADQALGNGDIARAQGRADQAVNAAAAEGDPKKYAEKWPSAMNMRAKVAKAAEDYSTANAYAAEVLKKFPKDPTALMLFHETKGRTTAGGVFVAPPKPINTPLAQGVNLNNDPRLAANAQNKTAMERLRDARHLLGINDREGALRLAQGIQSSDPGINAAAYSLQAQVWSVLGDLSKAVLQISEAIKLFTEKGDLASAYSQRASYQNGLKNHDEAVADASRAIENNPKLASAFYERSLAFEALKQPGKAREDMSQAAFLDKNFMADLDAQRTRMRQQGGEGLQVPRPAESPLGRAWTRLVDAAGGGYRLFAGAVGGAFLLAGGVFFFAKEGWTRFLTRPSALETPAAAAAGIEGMTFENGRYRAERQIGQGGMGAVHEGRDLKLDRPVAIKRMNGELLGDPAHRGRFVKEGETVARLRHPNIVDVYSICDEQGQLVIVFERVHGRDLFDIRRASENGRLDPGRIVEILGQVAPALDYAHREGVIHRDLKPSNIMIDQHGNAKVMDFGIARTLEHLRTTMTNTSVGTPAYMAPEQADGVVTKQSDVYALGVMAYEFLSGELPFRGEGAQLNKREGRFTPVSELMPGLPPAVDLVFKKVLDPNYAQRYASCAEFCQALKAALTPSP